MSYEHGRFVWFELMTKDGDNMIGGTIGVIKSASA